MKAEKPWLIKFTYMEVSQMGLFDMLFGAEKKEAALMEKRFREVAIVARYTAPEKTAEANANSTAPNFGEVVFKYKRSNKWIHHKVILREDVGGIKEGDQWIVKFDEEYTRIVAVHRPLSAGSVYRIVDDEE